MSIEQQEDFNLEDLVAEIDAETAVETLPEEPTEEDICNWSQRRIALELNCAPERVRVDAPIHTLGVPSVAAITITGDLSEALGRELPDTLLWDHPTIRSVAETLAHQESGEATEGAVALLRESAVKAGLSGDEYNELHKSTEAWPIPQAFPGSLTRVHQGRGADRAPVYWIAGYRAVQAMSDGLEPTLNVIPSGLRIVDHKPDKVRAMASVYADEFEAVQPDGAPFVLAGFCYGAKIALETGRELKRRGKAVRRVFVLEYPGPARKYWNTYAVNRKLIPENIINRAKMELGRLRPQPKKAGPAKAAAAPSSPPAEAEDSGVPATHWEYMPEPWDLPVTIVFARKSLYNIPLNPLYGWEHHLPRETTRLKMIEGEHLFVLSRETNRPLVRLLNKYTKV